MAENKIINVEESKSRRDYMRKLFDLYSNNCEKDVKHKLFEQYTTKNYDNIKKFIDKSLNTFREIIKQTSTVYKKPAQRQLLVNGNEVDNDRYNQLLKDVYIDTVMAHAHKISKACTMCFLRVKYIEELDKIEIEIHTPDNVHIETETYSNKVMKSFSYSFINKNKEYWVYYTADKILYLNASGSLLDENPLTDSIYKNENPYGFIPVIPFFVEAPIFDFFSPLLNADAYDAGIWVMIYQALLNRCSKYISFSQVWVKGADSEKLKNHNLDFSTLLDLGDDGEVGILKFDANAISILDTHIREKNMLVAMQYGISPSQFNMTGNVQSGYALRIEKEGLQEVRISDIPICTQTETSLFFILRFFNNYYYTEQIPEDAILKFNPTEIEYPEPWDTEKTKWEFEMDKGISNQVDYMISKDPELTREEALAKLNLIKKENETINPKTTLDRIIDGRNNSNQERK